MRNYNKDINIQIDDIFNKIGNEEVKKQYREELKKIFFNIYAINYIKNKPETNKYFNTEYFKITYSCLLESYSLILNNYQRGAGLVLRSSLENFIKHIIDIVNSIHQKKYDINDRSYSCNKSTLEKIIDNELKDDFGEISKAINSQMERIYRKLSGLSHSLTIESKSNILDYIFDLDSINNKNIELVINNYKEVSKLIFSLSVIICEPSLKLWEKNQLETVLRWVFGTRKTKTYISKLKS